MNWSELKADWVRHRAEVARRWQCLSERELDEIAGDRQRLAQRIADAYAISESDAVRQICDWESDQADWDPSSADGPPPQQPEQVAAGSEGAASAPGSEKLVATGAWPSEPQDQPGSRANRVRPATPGAEPGASEDDAVPADAGNPLLSEHLRHVGYMDDEATRETSESVRPGPDSSGESTGTGRGKASQQ
jgi:hypothetical protein